MAAGCMDLLEKLVLRTPTQRSRRRPRPCWLSLRRQRERHREPESESARERHATHGGCLISPLKLPTVRSRLFHCRKNLRTERLAVAKHRNYGLFGPRFRWCSQLERVCILSSLVAAAQHKYCPETEIATYFRKQYKSQCFRNKHKAAALLYTTRRIFVYYYILSCGRAAVDATAKGFAALNTFNLLFHFCLCSGSKCENCVSKK